MLFNFLLFIHALYRLSYSVLFVNHFYFRKNLFKQIEEVCLQKEQTIESKYVKRIYYHGLLGSIIKEWFTTLRGYPQTDQEAKAGFYLGTATAVYDDLFDHYNFTMDESLEDLAKGEYKHDNVTERLSKLFYDIILDNLKDQSHFDFYLRKVGLLQEESKKQETNKLSESELRRIIYEKGGYSVALCRSILEHEYRPGEQEAIYVLGSLIQFTDDVFDVRQDYLGKIATLTTTTQDIRKIRAEYEDLIYKSFAAFKKLDYPPRKLKQFFMQILIIVSRGMVCLNQLVEVQEKHGDTFQIEKYSRAELVCDMEKPINIFRSFWYCLRWKM